MIMLDHLWAWGIAAVLSALFNLTPVLAPPTWAMLAWVGAQWSLPMVPLAVVGAVGSTLGRVGLAFASRWLGMRVIPARRREDVERAVERVRSQQRLSLPALAMFAVGPIPKSMLFMAAGIARAPLVPGAVVYGVARFVIYLVALSAAGTAASSLGDIVGSPVGGPLLIAAQVASVAAVFLFFLVDVPRLLRRARALAMRLPGVRWLSARRAQAAAVRA